MDVVALKEILQNDKIPKDFYSLQGGLPNESYCIEKRGNNWEVYYSERGTKTDLKIFDTEDEACKHLYKRIKQMI